MKNMRTIFWVFLLFAVAAVVVFSQEKDWHLILFLTMFFLTAFLCDAFCWRPVSGLCPLLYGVVWFAKADI